MKARILCGTVLAALLMFTACGSKSESGSSNSSGSTTNKTAAGGDSKSSASSTSSASAGSPSSVMKAIYDSAAKRNCSAIPPMLTEDFRKSSGTTRDEMEALCDVFTDSGKLASFEVKGEQVSGDSAKVTTALTYKDGKKEDKEDSLKKVDGKWLMEP